MPNRIIKESICTSEKLNKLSDFHFRLWTCLITYVDDYGRGDARAAIIKGRCFPLRERVTVKDIETGLHVLADTGCISLYTVDGESYLCFPNWGQHQRIQQKRSKYPAPEDEAAPASNNPYVSKPRVDSHEETVNESKSRYVTVSHREQPSESNPNPNPNPNPNAIAGAGARAREAKAPSPTVTHGESPKNSEPETRRSLDRAFDAFWAAYPLHKSKVKAYEAFQALNPDSKLLEAMILAIQKQKSWRRMREGYIPMPATWIRERRWEDDEEPELTETKPRRVLAGQDYKQREYKESEMREILGVDSIFRADDPDSMFNEG